MRRYSWLYCCLAASLALGTSCSYAGSGPDCQNDKCVRSGSSDGKTQTVGQVGAKAQTVQNWMTPEEREVIFSSIEEYNSRARDIARGTEGRAYTDHKERHARLVREKAVNVADSLNSALKNGAGDQMVLGNASKNGNADYLGFGYIEHKRVLEAAAIYHDTGMSGHGYSVIKNRDDSYTVRQQNNQKYDFNDIRKNHSLNSGINILKKRAFFQELGFSDVEIDMMAMIAAAHSKSNSGIKNLNSLENWQEGARRIKLAADLNNVESQELVTFNPDAVFKDKKLLEELVSMAFVIRVADVSRDSFPGDQAQSGEVVNVHRDTVDSKAGVFQKEVAGATIEIGDKGDLITDEKSKQVHTGEQNIVYNDTVVSPEMPGYVNHRITVDECDFAPASTLVAIGDHLGEFKSAPEGQFIVTILFNKTCSDYARKLYEDYQAMAAMEYPNVTLKVIWEKPEDRKDKAGKKK